MRTKYIPMDQFITTPSSYLSLFCLIVAFSMIWCWMRARSWAKPICGSDKDTRYDSLTFGFRRVSPCGTQYEWWNGTHWMLAHDFLAFCIMRTKHEVDEAIQIYQITHHRPHGNAI